jgi:hypothetical protein
MPILDNYTDDKAMAEYGRQCAKYKAIREHKEAVRDICVAIQNANDDEGVSNLQKALNEHIEGLKIAIKLM